VFGGSKEDRRGEARKPANRRALVLASASEIVCRITDESRSGLRLRLDRRTELPKRVVVVDLQDALALEVEVRWVRGQEAGGRTVGQTGLRGLVPQRLAAAREAWARAGGR
jgi:hypothetical protein